MYKLKFVLLLLIFSFFSCKTDPEGVILKEPQEPLKKDSITLSDWAKKATVFIASNYYLKVRETNLFVSQKGTLSEYRSDAKVYTLHGTGIVFFENGQYRILTAKHLVATNPVSVFDEELLSLVTQLMIDEGFVYEKLSKESIEFFAQSILEIVPLTTPGWLVLPGSSAVTYNDQFNRTENLMPRIATA